MALQHGVDRLQLLDYIDFQSPLTGQWPCNSVVTEPYWGLYILSVPSNGAMALQPGMFALHWSPVFLVCLVIGHFLHFSVRRLIVFLHCNRSCKLPDSQMDICSE